MYAHSWVVHVQLKRNLVSKEIDSATKNRESNAILDAVVHNTLTTHSQSSSCWSHGSTRNFHLGYSPRVSGT